MNLEEYMVDSQEGKRLDAIIKKYASFAWDGHPERDTADLARVVLNLLASLEYAQDRVSKLTGGSE